MDSVLWKSVCCTSSPIVGVRLAEPGYVIVTPQNFSVYIVDVESGKKLAVWNIEDAVCFSLPATYCSFNKRYYAVANNTLILELAVENEVAVVKRRFTVQCRVAEIIGTANPIFVLESGLLHILVDEELWTLSDRLTDEAGVTITNVAQSVIHVTSFERIVVIVLSNGTFKIARLDEATNTLQFESLQLAPPTNVCGKTGSSDSSAEKRPVLTSVARVAETAVNSQQSILKFALFWSNQHGECVRFLRKNQSDRYITLDRLPIALRATMNAASVRVRECTALNTDWIAATVDSNYVHLLNLRIGLRSEDERFRIALPARASRLDHPASASTDCVLTVFERLSGSLLCFMRSEVFALRVDNSLLSSALADLVSTSHRSISAEPSAQAEPGITHTRKTNVRRRDTFLEARIVDELLSQLTAQDGNSARMDELISLKVTESVCISELKRLERSQLVKVFDFLAGRLCLCASTSFSDANKRQTDAQHRPESVCDVNSVVHWLMMLIDAQMGAFVTFAEFHSRLVKVLQLVRSEVQFLDTASSLAVLAEHIERLAAERRSKRRRVEATADSDESYSVELISF